MLALEPVRVLRPAGEPGEAARRVDAQQERPVGREAARAEVVEAAHGLDPQLPPGALVGERGVDEAVEQHPAAGVEQRPQPLRHELRARRGVEERLGPRVDLQRGVLDEGADALGQRHAARLAQHDDLGARARAAPAPGAPTSVVLPAPSIPSTVIRRPAATSAHATSIARRAPRRARAASPRRRGARRGRRRPPLARVPPARAGRDRQARGRPRGGRRAARPRGERTPTAPAPGRCTAPIPT